jgi:hypothetical protein
MSAMLGSEGNTVNMRRLVERKPVEARNGRKIYFILCQATGRVKCGVGADPRARLADLQVGSPTPLKLIAEIDGDYSKEKLIHRRLDRWHIHGEWFHYVPEVCDIIVDEIANHLKDLYHGDCLVREVPTNLTVVQNRFGDQRIHLFLSDYTVSSPGARTQSNKLYRAFEAWCQSSGASACSQKAFTTAMAGAGYRRMQSNVIFFLDIRLKAQEVNAKI